MRGGTSKGVFLLKRDLEKYPQDKWDDIILDLFGSPDSMQIDGLGGTHSTTSKVMIVSSSSGSEADVEYTFGQVAIDKPFIDWQGNCGNLTSAVAPFAIQEEIVAAEEPYTTVIMYNTNTKKFIRAKVEVQDGRVQVEGDYKTSGVPKSGSKITNIYLNPSGAITGSLLPTGNVIDLFFIDGEEYRVSIVDATNPFVFVEAIDFGLKGTELPPMINEPSLLDILEKIRSKAAQTLGIIKKGEIGAEVSPGIPKLAIVSSSQIYKTSLGETIQKEKIQLVARALSMQKPHHAYQISGALCTAAASVIKGTIVNEVADNVDDSIVIGHPKGTSQVGIKYTENNGLPTITELSIGRTARRLLTGYAYFRA